MSKIAIVIGATGLTGSFVLDMLLNDERYSKVLVFSRKSTAKKHSKLTEYIVDVLQLEKYSKEFVGDEVYCCIGTTKKKTPDPELYRSIDFGIPLSVAKLAKENKIPCIAVVSAIGANSKSSFEYNRIKGDMEQAILDQKIPHSFILRPSLIAGPRKEKRKGEKLSLLLFRIMKYIMIGPLKKYRAVEAEQIAKRMIQLSNDRPDTVFVESNEI